MKSPEADSAGTLVYLIDDEPVMLDLAEMALAQVGCTVRKFTDPREAYAAFLSEPAKPRLLLTDYAMAPMNGVELSEKCKAADPAVRVLMVSGSIEESFARSNAVVDGFVGKPYQTERLAQRVRDLLATA